MSARGTSGKAAVDGSVGDCTPPVSSLTIHHFVLQFLYLKTAFCITAFDKALAPADRSRYAPAPPIEKLICGVICQPILRLCQTVTHAYTHTQAEKKKDSKHLVEDGRGKRFLNDEVVAFVSNIIVSLLVHRGVCEMLVWGTASCLCPQQYVQLAGQLLTGNCILNLDNTILICSSCQ